MNIYLASDHAGFDLKHQLMKNLRAQGHEVTDLGAAELNPEDDYPDFVTPCAARVAAEPGSCGIVLGGSGQGEAMAANRVKGVRAGVYYGGSLEIIKLLREHNDANILSLGARFLTNEEALGAVATFLATPFSDAPRHARRLAKF